MHASAVHAHMQASGAGLAALALSHPQARLKDSFVDHAAYETTLDEVKKGWLDGPIPEESLSSTALVTRRFGVVQNGKIRPIENYLESGLSATASASDTITVHTADCIAAGLARRLEVDLKCRSHRLLIQTWDLHKAYKHLPLSSSGLDDSFLSVYDPVSDTPRICVAVWVSPQCAWLLPDVASSVEGAGGTTDSTLTSIDDFVYRSQATF